MLHTNNPHIFILTGKHPRKYAGGRESYAITLASIFHRLRYRVTIWCNDNNTVTYPAPFGAISTIGSGVFRIPVINTVPMIVLPIIAFFNAREICQSIIRRKLPTSDPIIIWGMGPWTLTAVLLRRMIPNRCIIIADYCTTMAHELHGMRAGISLRWYPIVFVAGVSLFRLCFAPLFHLIERFILTTSDAVVVQYRSSARILRHEFGLSRSRLHHLPFPSVPQILAGNNRLLPPLPSPVIALVSRQDARKGIPYLLDALVLLNKENVSFTAVIAGDGPLLAYHRSYAERLGLQTVVFPGAIGNPTRLLTLATLYVFPSLEEGGSALSLLEAMRYGIPIVSTNVDGIPEDIRDGKEGLLVPPKNPAELARAMKRILTSPALAAQLGQQAKIRFFANHDPKCAQMLIRQFLSTFF